MEKKKISVFLIIFLLILFKSSYASEKSDVPNGLKTIEISYKVTNDNVTGIEVISIDFQGNRMREEKTINSLSGTKTKIIILYDGIRKYGLGVWGENEAIYSEYKGNAWDERFKKSGKRLEASETIAGKVCDVYEEDRSEKIHVKKWFWHDILLKQVTKIDGGMTSVLEATGIKENPILDDSLFTLPAGYSTLSEEDVENEANEIRKSIKEHKDKIDRDLKPQAEMMERYKTVQILFNITENMYKYNMTTTSKRILSIDFQGNRMRDERGLQNCAIFDGKRLYHIDIKSKKATYLEPVGQDYLPWEDDKLYGMGFDRQPVGSEKIAGEDCQIYEHTQDSGKTDVKIWSWNGLILKEVIKYDYAIYTMEATEIKRNIVLNDDLFILPSGYLAEKRPSPWIENEPKKVPNHVKNPQN